MWKQWEYKIINLNDPYVQAPLSNEEAEDFLNRLGDRGWELVNGQDGELIFKREKRGKLSYRSE